MPSEELEDQVGDVCEDEACREQANDEDDDLEEDE